jgi:hypothetical protein
MRRSGRPHPVEEEDNAKEFRMRASCASSVWSIVELVAVHGGGLGIPRSYRRHQ